METHDKILLDLLNQRLLRFQTETENIHLAFPYLLEIHALLHLQKRHPNYHKLTALAQS